MCSRLVPPCTIHSRPVDRRSDGTVLCCSPIRAQSTCSSSTETGPNQGPANAGRFVPPHSIQPAVHRIAEIHRMLAARGMPAVHWIAAMYGMPAAHGMRVPTPQAARPKALLDTIFRRCFVPAHGVPAAHGIFIAHGGRRSPWDRRCSQDPRSPKDRRKTLGRTATRVATSAARWRGVQRDP